MAMKATHFPRRPALHPGSAGSCWWLSLSAHTGAGSVPFQSTGARSAEWGLNPHRTESLKCTPACLQCRGEGEARETCVYCFAFQLPMQWCSLDVPWEEKPSWLHTTEASAVSHELPQTVPHIPLKQTSTLPSDTLPPPTSLTAPLAQEGLCTVCVCCVWMKAWVYAYVRCMYMWQ